MILSTAYDGEINVRDFNNKSPSKVLEKRSSSFIGLSVWDNETVVSWELEGHLSVWDITKGIEVSTLENAVMRYYELSTEPPFLLWRKYNWIVIWATLELEFWNPESGESEINIMEHKDSIEGATLLEEDRLLTWSADASLKIWTPNATVEATLTGHKSAIRSVILLEDQTILSWDHQDIIIWNKDSNLPQYIFKSHQSRIVKVWEVSEEYILSRSIEGQHFVWHRKTGEVKIAFRDDTHQGILLPLKSLYVTWIDTSITLWNLESGEKTIIEKAHNTPIQKIIALGTNRMVSWSADATIKTWEGL